MPSPSKSPATELATSQSSGVVSGAEVVLVASVAGGVAATVTSVTSVDGIVVGGDAVDETVAASS